MVQTDVSQLSGECAEWREVLRNQRESLSQLREQLQQFASKELPKDTLREVEHYHNQFHIQLINIHDLKQSIKVHDRKIHLENALSSSSSSEEDMLRHDSLRDEYVQLMNTLDELKHEFRHFLIHA
jgi:transposase